jgi:probable HAF family extracellular repeat protein
MKRAILMATTAAIGLVLAVVPAFASSHVAAKLSHYTVYPLDNSLGGAFAQGSSINEKDEIGGFGTLPGDTVMHALIWRARLKPKDLGTLGGPNSAIAWPNKNEHGIYAGISETAGDNPLGETWSCALAVFFLAPPTGKICQGFRWQNGDMQALPPLYGGYNSFATGVNNDGEIVGWAEDGVHEPTCNAPQVLQFEAVVWEPNGDIRQLPPAAGDLDGAATAINDKGQVVGISGVCGNAIGGASAQHMLLWDRHATTDLGNLGGQYWHTPMDISEVGHVTGFSDLPGDSADHPNFNAFFWSRKTGLQNLQTLPGDSISEGLGINNRDQVVGVSYPSSHAFIWQKGAMTDLNTLISPASNLVLLAGQEINDSGAITGQAQDKNTGALVGFVAVPKWR